MQSVFQCIGRSRSLTGNGGLTFESGQPSLFALVAQLGELVFCNDRVAGSNPAEG